MVYILEAHPKGGAERGPDYSVLCQHETLEDRIKAATMLIDLDVEYHTFTADIRSQTQIPLVLDTIDNVFTSTFAAAPDRAYVVENNSIAYLGRPIVQQIMTEIDMAVELREFFEKKSYQKKNDA
ncbi:type I iodothyronine deiodinase-like [Saccoglossus kowalevskii]